MLRLPRFKIVGVTDLITKAETYGIYERPIGRTPPIASGLTREEAAAKIKELEAEFGK